ncbi:MAG: hypothetical protein ACI9N1_000266 [Flavobacteriales bacterium]|jgi:uncharacterized protein (DUF1800 family)
MKSLFIVTIFIRASVLGQNYSDYVGAGHNVGVTVTTSDNHQQYSSYESGSGENTINGKGMQGKLIEASRFLSQAALGADLSLIEDVANTGIENWIDNQFTITPTFYADTMTSIYSKSLQAYTNLGYNPANYPSRPNHIHMDYTWWNNNMQAPDILRQRIAYGLSELLVVSTDGTLSSYAAGASSYYDVLVGNTFGNYEDLLKEVTLHPAMGIYLSHLNNPKTDTVNNIHPDENYAREIMQLFSIGLHKLNLDGSLQLDLASQPIPTYNNDQIAQFAKVFTGLGYGQKQGGLSSFFGMTIYTADLTVPMIMFDAHHEPGTKILLDGYVIPNGQTGMQDVEDAVHHLFMHPNVGPFLAKRLIQHLVKSNPSPAYISAVATAFNDNGQGERGDMKAVVKTILMHSEARDCNWTTDATQGKLREPILKYIAFAKAIETFTAGDTYWNYSYWFMANTGQHPMKSPSVFNFFGPGYVPNGPIADNNLVAPEFEIYNSRTSIGFANSVYTWIESEEVLKTSSYEGYLEGAPNFTNYPNYAMSSDVLLNRLDLLFTHGLLSERTRGIIKTSIDGFGNSLSQQAYRIKLATYLVLISPDYNILK